MRSLAIALLLTGCSSRSIPDSVESSMPIAQDPGAGQSQPKSTKSEESTAMANEAVTLVAKGDIDGALAQLRKALAIDRDNVTAWYNLGQLHKQRESFEEAANAFGEAARIDDDGAMYHYQHGKALWNCHSKVQRNLAEASLRRAIEKEPQLYNAHYQLGLVFEAKGQAMDAAKSWTLAAAISPSFNLAYESLGFLYLRWNKIDEALFVFEKAQKNVSDKAEVLYGLAIVYEKLGRLNEAIKAYNEFLILEPGNLDAIRQRGFAYAGLGEREKARHDLELFVRAGAGSNAMLIQAANQQLARLKGKPKRNLALKKPATKSKTSLATEVVQVPFNPAQTPASTSKFVMPRIPDFKVPPMNGSSHSIEELLVQSKPYLGSDIEVRGVVAWIYDCASAVRTSSMSKKEAARIVREEPQRCARPHLQLASKQGARIDQYIEVVEVPRDIRPDERKAMPKEMLDNWPAVPKLKVGDEVIVQGTWALQSPMGFFNSKGLLVFKSVHTVR